jgi:hypothetical protein
VSSDIGHDDTQRPWDGRERRVSHADAGCPVADAAHRDVRELHDLLHGNGRDRGVFEQLRVLGKSSDDLAQSVAHIETQVAAFDHKLDETLRVAKEELRVTKQRALPLWMTGTGALAAGLFFLVRLWRDMIGR